MFIDPALADFKAFFFRDFPYGTDDQDVQDQDINNALALAPMNFNSALWSTQAEYTQAFLYVAAHLMVMSLRASSQGIAGKFTWLEGSKGVGAVSGSYQFPEKITKNPIYAMYTQTRYGAMFLQLALPRLVGYMFTSHRRTLP